MISIIIPTYKRTEMLYHHVDHFLQQTLDLSYELIIVNDDKRVTIPKPEHWDARVTIVNNPKSGVASARNFGASLAQFEWLLFVDDDMLMNRHNLETFYAHCDANRDKTVNMDWRYTEDTLQTLRKNAFGRFLIAHGFTDLKGWNGVEHWPEHSSCFEAQGLSSCNLLIHTSVFDQVSGYDEHFPFAGAEDFEFSQRVKAAGIPTLLDVSSYMIHNELDRLTPRQWFQRKYRDGVTKRIAYDLGYKEQFIENSFKFRFPIFMKNLLSFALFFSSKTRRLDKLSFLFFKALLGQHMYSGFYKS